MPRSPARFKIVDVNGKKLHLPLKKTVSAGSVYKNVKKRGNLYNAYVTRKGQKKFIGSFQDDEAAALEIATILQFGADYEPSPEKKEPKEDPLMGIFDEEADRLKSPESVASSVFSPKGIASGNLRPSALRGRPHKSLLQSWEEDHGTKFEPTPNASNIRIPFSSRLS